MSKILVVDDIEQNRYLLETLLTGHGHEVITAENGEEALKATGSVRPDLLISDILMPVMDGFTLCRKWKNDPKLSGIPFIFYTATYTDPKDEKFGLSLGAERYLTKPMEPDALMESIQEVLDLQATVAPDNVSDGADTEGFFLKEYNEALIRKLESKMLQLEKTNQQLEREIKERHQAEDQLIRLYTAIESAAEAIIITDGNGRIEYTNPAFEKITGYSFGLPFRSEANSGKTEHPESLPFDKLRDVLTSGQPWEGNLTEKNALGNKIELVCTVSPIVEKDRNITGFVSVIRDVTEQVKLENQLMQSQKMEAIGTMAGGIAHDFNNILSAIYGYTDLALFDTPIGSSTRRYLNSLINACDRAKNLVDQILTFSRKAERERIIMDFGSLVKECRKFLRASLPSTVDIRLNMDLRNPMILADPIQIHQVILNICTNAAFAMRDSGGTLDIHLRTVDLDHVSAQIYPELPPGEYQLLSISDTGAGIDKETLSRIFEPFFTTKDPGEGTGLGLAVAHGIIKSHHGNISVYSELGQGTTFNIYIPAAKGPSQERGALIGETLPTGTERILFVDDEEPLVEIGEMMLKKLGYQVTAVQSSPMALELFESDPDGFDLVITDQTMPKITGMDLAKKIRCLRPKLPIIICTGFSVHLSEETVRAASVNGLMIKPLVMRDVANKIRAVID